MADLRLSRRHLLGGAAAMLAAGASAQAPAESATQLLAAAAGRARLPLRLANGTWSGPGWERLVAEGREAQVFMLGEDHGLAEIPLLAGALFEALRPAGYDCVSLEISDAAALQADAALLRGGLAAFETWLGGDPVAIAFYAWQSEAAFLERVRRAVPPGRRAIYGTDYEPFATRQLADALALRAPLRARPAAQALAGRVRELRREAGEAHNLGRMFGFSERPAVLDALRAAWPAPDPASARILRTLERTLAINNLFLGGQRWQSNQLRADFQRETFLAHWREAARQGRTPRMLMKYGANHMRRGLDDTEVFDLGTLGPELAAEAGGRAFQLIALGGKDAVHAVLNGETFGTDTALATAVREEGYALFEELAGDDVSLFDLRALRPFADNRAARQLDPRLVALVHGFDAMLLIPHATAARPLPSLA